MQMSNQEYGFYCSIVEQDDATWAPPGQTECFADSAPCDNTFASHPDESEWNNIYTDAQLTRSLESAFEATFGVEGDGSGWKREYDAVELYCMECRNWCSYAAI